MLKLPAAMQAFANALKDRGVTLYAVGGCVRDALLNRPVHDIDLASRLRPDELLKAAEAFGIEARIVQKTLGTVLLTVDGVDYEHTTFRTESYGAGGAHRPDAVRFSDTPEVDAFRRDFSVNALYESVPDGALVDPTGGLPDLERRVLRTATADPSLILRDDGLRILRLVRFAASLGFSIDPDTWEAAKENAALLEDVAWERKRQELDKILTGPRTFDALTMLKDVGALPYVLPELCACDGLEQKKQYHRYDVLTHLFHTCENTPAELSARLTGLLHDVGKPVALERDGKMYAHDRDGERIARVMLARLRYPNTLIDRVAETIRLHMFDLTDEASDATIRRRFACFGRERTTDLITIREADVRGSGVKPGFVAERWRRVFDEMQREGAPFSESELAVNGDDIVRELGVAPGERVGRIKRKLLERCAVHPEENDRETLLRRMHDYA
jgi:tRNA nucleotidyltransferase/poly(A) polymerase